MTQDPQILSVETKTHGRVLARRAADPRGVLVGFHGYFENAGIQLERLDAIPGAERWTRVAIQALHRVYRGRSPVVVASWMTSEDRDEMIADNVAYVGAALRAIEPDASVPVVYVGFSQGGQMAFRAAVRGAARAAGIISVGAVVPPELPAAASAVFPPVLLARGEQDEWYTREKHDRDLGALRARGASVEPLVYPGGHDWTAEVSEAAAAWLERLR